MRVRMTIEIYDNDSWRSDIDVQAELTADRQVVSIAGWEGIARRLVKQALNEFDTREDELEDEEKGV